MTKFVMTNAVIETRKRSKIKRLGRLLFETVVWLAFFGMILSLLFIGPAIEAEIVEWKASLNH